VSAHFRPISNLNNISKNSRGFFLHDYSLILPAHLVSIIYNQLIANVTLLKPLIHLHDSIYHAADNALATLLSLDLSAAFDTIDHTIVLNRLTSSHGQTTSWVPLTTGLSPISPTGLSQSLPDPLPLSYLHLVMFPKALSWVRSFSQFMSHLLLQSYISSHGVNQQQYANGTQPFVFLPLPLYLVVSAASSVVQLAYSQ